MADKRIVECPSPGCGAKLSISKEKMGKKVRCPRCKEVFESGLLRAVKGPDPENAPEKEREEAR